LNTARIDPESFVFGKDFNAEQRAAFDAMAAERGSGMDASLLNQDRSIGNSDGQYYYNAIRDEAIKPNNILNGYLGVQPIPNLMANGSSTRGSRGNISSGMTMPTLQERGIGTGTQGYGMGVPTLQEQGIGDAQQYLRQDMMANGSSNRGVNTASNMMASGSNNGRGVDTSLSNTMGRDIAKGMGDGLNNVMRMTENIQSKYGDPNDKTIDEIMAKFNADNEYNRVTESGMSKAQSDKILADAQLPFRDQGGSGFLNSLDPIDFAFRMAAGGDTTQNSIDAHRRNKTANFGDGLMAYKDENMLNQDGTTYTPVSDATDGYHFKSGKDAGKIARGDMTMGGLPMGLFGHLYQQGTGLIKGDGSFGKGAYLQAVDNNRGLAASGNAPFLQNFFDKVTVKAPSLSDFVPSGLLNRSPSEDAIRIAKQKEAGTFQPGKKAQAYEQPKQTVADRKGYTPQPKAKAKVKVDYNKNTPAPTQKKQSRAGAGAAKAKITRTTGSRGGRGNVAKKRRTGGR